MNFVSQRVISILCLSLCALTFFPMSANPESRYRYNHKLSDDQILGLEPKDLFRNTNPIYIDSALNKAITSSAEEEKWLNRSFVLLVRSDAGYAEFLSMKLHKLMLKKQEYFFRTLSKLDMKTQRLVCSCLISLPDNNFNIKSIKKNQDTDVIFSVYDDYIKHQ